MEILSLSMAVSVFQLAVSLGVLFHAIGRTEADERHAPLVYFLFATAVYLVSDLYWVAHLLMLRESIYPFSAIDVADFGIGLLLASAINIAVGRGGRPNRQVLAGTIVFSAANALLWLAWTGDWLKDVLGGFGLWFLLYEACLAVSASKAMTRLQEAVLLTCGCAALLLQLGALWDVGGMGTLCDAISSLSWIASIVMLLVLWVRSDRQDAGVDKGVSLAALGIGWSMCAIYLSFEPYYSVASILIRVMVLCLYRSLLRKVEEA